MKKFKKLLAVMLAAVMVMAMGSTAVFAADEYSVTITGVAADNHTFSAWQIFAGTVSSDGKTLGDVTWGVGVNYSDSVNQKTIYEALAEITITESNATVYPFTDDPTAASGGNALTSAADVAKALATYNSNSGILDEFINAITLYLKTTATASSDSPESGGSAGNYSYKIDVTSYGSGYYLVKDTTLTLGTDDAYTDFIVQILGTQSVAVKSSVPTVTKTVTDTDGTTQVDETSASANEKVTFTLTATMPSTYADYTTYSLTFHDKLSTNLTYNEDAVVTVNNYTACDDTLSQFDPDTTYYVLTDGAYVETSDSTPQTATTYYTCVSTVVGSGYSVTQPTSGDYNLKIAIDNTNALYDKETTPGLIDVDSTTTIVVTYTATVGSGVIAGTYETNSVALEYSNDPNNTSETGKTTTEIVYVQTFNLKVNKVDGDDNNAALSGAKFSLYKKVSVTEWEDNVTYYTISGTTATAVNKATVTKPETGVDYYILVEEDKEASENSGSYTAKFEDLGEGTYALVESVTPNGYNTINAIIFTITATYNADGSVKSLSASDSGNSITFTADTDKTAVSTTIANHKGATIPTTGGMGTTILYIIGAILVIGAAVLLITRRRMANR